MLLQKLSKVLPISSSEFYEALSRIWQPPPNGRRPRLGIAVSGGVDSMALASLCKTLSLSHPTNPALIAFIIDHQAREGSSEEACWVSDQLRNLLNIESKVISIDWPKNQRPCEITNFENIARRLRYRAIGLACRDNGTDSLLVAHHSDDQAETILMKLLEGRHGLDLRGMRSSRQLPECFGLYGVHNSGCLSSYPLPSIPIETGGVRILRPLLSFDKERLRATCLNKSIPWVEDKTNADKTFTVRNAVRWVYYHNRLPNPLNKSSLLALSDRVKIQESQHIQIAQTIFEKCKIKLDLRSGMLTVHFPSPQFVSERLYKLTEYSKFTVLLKLLEWLVRFVVPESPVIFESLRDVIMRDQLSIMDIKKKPKPLPMNFTAAGVLFEDITISSKNCLHEAVGRVWRLCRRPYDRRKSPMLEVSTVKFELWDGRYWIRIKSSLEYRVFVRPLTPEDIQKFRRELTRPQRARFKSVLAAAAPGKVRFTLPVLAVESDVGKPIMMALPTLGIKATCTGDGSGISTGFSWDVRYGKISLEGHDPDKVLIH